jgi:hypothetical protein
MRCGAQIEILERRAGREMEGKPALGLFGIGAGVDDLAQGRSAQRIILAPQNPRGLG